MYSGEQTSVLSLQTPAGYEYEEESGNLTILNRSVDTYSDVVSPNAHK